MHRPALAHAYKSMRRRNPCTHTAAGAIYRQHEGLSSSDTIYLLNSRLSRIISQKTAKAQVIPKWVIQGGYPGLSG